MASSIAAPEAPEATASAQLAALLAPRLGRRAPAFAQMLDVLQPWCVQHQGARSMRERKLVRTVEHALFLLGDGRPLASACRIVAHGAASALELQRVVEADDTVQIITLRLAMAALDGLAPSFHSWLDGPALWIWQQPLMIDARPEHALPLVPMAPLLAHELAPFFAHQDSIVHAIERHGLADGEAYQATLQAHAAALRAEVGRRYAALGTGHGASASAASHPFLRPVLHVLPRLIEAPPGTSILRHLAAQLDALCEHGFGALMLGVVDPQSVGVYYSADEDGRLRAWYNDHGYWSTGQSGIDPVLGTEADYRALVAAAVARGLTVIQDAVFATLGYPAQLARFATSTLDDPLRCLVLGHEPVSVCDAQRFLHDGAWMREANGACDPEVEAVVQTQLGAVFVLPRPNLFDPAVLDAVMARTRWQGATAGVAAFRIDMAKHLPAPQLRAIIARLREQQRAGGQPCRLLLEYLSTDYSDLAYAHAALEQQAAGCYLYDFPLAACLHRIFADGAPMQEEVGQLLAQRRRWAIGLWMLVPTLIDHDAMFPPWYDGSADTQAALVAGYALALLLSAQSPYVYMGFDDARAGVGLGARAAPTEARTRCSRSALFCSDPGSPASALAALFAALSASAVLEHWDGGDIVCEGNADEVRIVRHVRDPSSGLRQRVEASVGRRPPDACTGGNLIYRFDAGVAVRIRIDPAAVDAGMADNDVRV